MSDHGERDELDGLRRELERWRTRLGELRVQAHLGGMELKDKLREAGDALEPACRDAQERLSDLARGGKDEVDALVRSLQAGWDALLKTHRDLGHESERERKDEWDQRRHT